MAPWKTETPYSMSPNDHELLASLTVADKARFLSRLQPGTDPGACWEWPGYLSKSGYGTFSVGKRGAARMLLTHRVAYTITIGIAPRGDERVLHRCDNRPCCNPAHLFVGTQHENVRDMREKGRARYTGPNAPATRVTATWNGPTKLTEGDVRIIRARVAAGETYQAVGADFGVTKVMVGRIARLLAWKHVT